MRFTFIKQSKTQRRRWAIQRMWNYDRRCHWCREPTVLVDRTGQMRHKGFLENEATIDHLDSRYSPERGKHPWEFRRVLACYACNRERNRQEQKQLPIQTKWERGGQLRYIARLSGAINEVT